MPEREEDRARLREIVAGDVRLPARYADAAIGACDGCGLAVEVPPRIGAVLLQDPTIVLVCPWCAAVASVDADRIGIVNLENPESRPED